MSDDLKEYYAMKEENSSAVPKDSSETVFYLWEENIVFYEIYQIIKNYKSDYGGLSTTVPVIIDLVKEFNSSCKKRRQVTLKEALASIPIIHAGYLEITMPDTGD